MSAKSPLLSLLLYLLFGALLFNGVLAQDAGEDGILQSSPDPQGTEPAEQANSPTQDVPGTQIDTTQTEPNSGMQDELAMVNYELQTMGPPPTEEQIQVVQEGQDGDISSEELSFELEAEPTLDPNMRQLATWSAQKLAQAGAQRTPKTLPTEIPAELKKEEPESWEKIMDPTFNSLTTIVLTPSEWDSFAKWAKFGYGGASNISWMWWTCKVMINWRVSIENLLTTTIKYVKTRDPQLAKRLEEAQTAFITGLTPVTNIRAGNKRFTYHFNGLCDQGGFLTSPNPAAATNSQAERDAEDKFLKRMFMYDDKTYGPDKITMSDDLFLHNWNILHLNLNMQVNWLKNTFTPLMRDINAKLFPKRDLIANINPRPLGVWKRKQIGLAGYWRQKYSSIYKYIPPDFGYWGVWNDPETVTLVADAPEMLLLATHSTAVGFIRGIEPFLSELFIDIALKAWGMGNMASFASDPEFALPGVNDYERTNFGIQTFFLQNAAERNDNGYQANAAGEYSDVWNDRNEKAKYEWRDLGLQKIELAKQAKVTAEREKKEKEAKASEAAKKNQPLGNTATKRRKTKKPKQTKNR
ncbi:hypothetical protein ABW20_dc0109967 [Dactylellina cionopaga]|nr:hypothetical protein ABW20_dc0109967 [Dactylellina cionopaga]